MKLLLGAIGAAVLAISAPAHAVSVAHQTAQGGYTTNVFGGSEWTGFTAMFDATHTRTAIADFSSAAVLAGFDAVWVDQELGNTLSGAEVANLNGYVAAGHKAVLIGENSSWAAWNASLMSVVGGSHTDDCDWGFGGPLMGGVLTSGIASVQNICGSKVGAGGGAQLLFGNDMAALYAVGLGQALVILDSNWNDNTYMSSVDNEKFAGNVITWLATPVPEPSTWLLMALGLGAVGVFARKR